MFISRVDFLNYRTHQQGAGAEVFGWSRSRHFGPAPVPVSVPA